MLTRIGDTTERDADSSGESLAREPVDEFVDAVRVGGVDVDPDLDVDEVGSFGDVAEDSLERGSATDVRALGVVDVGRAVDRHLSRTNTMCGEPLGHRSVEVPPVGDDRRGVRALVLVAQLDEPRSEIEQLSRSEQGLATHPGHVEPPDAGHRVAQHADQRIGDPGLEQRGMLVLEAVRAVEVAAQAGHDGVAEGVAAPAAVVVAAPERCELVGFVVDDRTHPDEVLEERFDPVALRTSGHEGIDEVAFATGHRLQGPADAAVHPDLVPAGR